jgi:hypothetical protein
MSKCVIPAQAGIQCFRPRASRLLDPRLSRDDGEVG